MHLLTVLFRVIIFIELAAAAAAVVVIVVMIALVRYGGFVCVTIQLDANANPDCDTEATDADSAVAAHANATNFSIGFLVIHFPEDIVEVHRHFPDELLPVLVLLLLLLPFGRGFVPLEEEEVVSADGSLVFVVVVVSHIAIVIK